MAAPDDVEPPIEVESEAPVTPAMAAPGNVEQPIELESEAPPIEIEAEIVMPPVVQHQAGIIPSRPNVRESRIALRSPSHIDRV